MTASLLSTYILYLIFIYAQGENNAGYADDYTGRHRDIYDCTFSNMISTWRQRWCGQQEEFGADCGSWEVGHSSVSTYLHICVSTYLQFPFGFVQLAPYTQQTTHLAWPELRWRQVASYLPNRMSPSSG